MESKVRYVKSKAQSVSRRNSINRYESDYKRFLFDTSFEKEFIDEISKKDLEGILELNCKRYDLTPKSFAGLRLILGMTFKYAYQEDLIETNIIDKIDFEKFRYMLSEPKSIEDRKHTDKELENIIEALHEKQESRPRYIVPYALELQILMGQRRGEVPPLMWSDIHFEAEIPYIEISREQLTSKKTETTKEYFVIAEYTKTHKTRRFPITEKIKGLLERLKEVHRKYNLNSPFLFPAETETGVITNNTVYNLYRRICNRLGIGITRDLIKGPHSFRRNGITNFINKGGTLLTASKLYGNSPDVAKSNYYTGIDMEMSLKVLNSNQGNQR